MAFPIRFKLTPRADGDKDAIASVESDMATIRGQLMLDGKGQPWLITTDNYTFASKLSSKDWILMVATRKDAKGNWVYENVSFEG